MVERIVSGLRDENAATTGEYRLIATAIAVVIIIVILTFRFIDVSSAITS
jgi:Flp pilus assembly pilin Flp